MSPLALCRNPQPASRPLSVPENPLGPAHRQLLAALGSAAPSVLPICALADDLENRGEHVRGLLDAMYAYLRAVLGDVARNVPCDLDLRQIEALWCDLASEVAGTMAAAAAALPGRRS
jgi:hypothetical protein